MTISRQQSIKSKKQRPDTQKSRGTNRAALLEKAIQSIEEKLGTSEVKATFSDFIRLLQLQKEMQIDQPREVKVTWIDPSEPESASEE
jgi:hypothetical protein